MGTWISYVIPYDSIPGRMSPIVTVLLAMMNTLTQISSFDPSIESISALKLYAIISIIQVFIYRVFARRVNTFVTSFSLFFYNINIAIDDKIYSKFCED